MVRCLSVHLFIVCPIYQLLLQCAVGLLLVAPQTGDIDRPIIRPPHAAVVGLPIGQGILIDRGSCLATSSMAFSSKCKQCYVVSWCWKLKRDLLLLVYTVTESRVMLFYSHLAGRVSSTFRCQIARLFPVRILQSYVQQLNWRTLLVRYASLFPLHLILFLSGLYSTLLLS